MAEVRNLEQLLDRIDEASRDAEDVTLGHIMETVGRRSFGPLLLLTGLVTVSPLGGIPILPSLLAVLVFIVAIQLLFQRKYFWMPRWLLRRTIKRGKIETTLKWTRRPARFIDRGLKSRLQFFTHKAGTLLVAAICLLVALGMPPMELVPFSVTVAGITLLLFGLALIAHDGLMMLIGIIFAVVAYGFLFYQLF